MKLSRTSRLIAACLTLIGMLFMQLAVASYVCPGTASGEGMPMAASAPMPGCTGMMDKVQPTLCHASAHSHDQSLYTPQLPPIDPFIVAQVIPGPTLSALASLSEVSPAPSTSLKRTTAPPIAIRHCCFRI